MSRVAHALLRAEPRLVSALVWRSGRVSTRVSRLQARVRAPRHKSHTRGAGRVAAVLLVGLLCLFAAGVIRLLAVRLATGDVYPELSTLNPDRLGAKALYESVAALPGFTARRNFQAIQKVSPEHATIFFLDLWPDFDNTRDLDSLAAHGARVVIAAPPVAKLAEAEKNRWGLHLAVCPLTAAERIANRRSGRPRFTAVYFARLDPAWHVIETGGCGAVVMERAFGKGSIVLAANALLFSNQALANHAQTIASVIGSNRTVIFDESHLGIEETPGMAALARRYRLQWVVAACIVLAMLFVWRNAKAFPPVVREPNPEDEISGRDTAFGLAQLLRRSVSPQDLIATCVKIAQVPEPQDSGRDPVEAYRRIAASLERR